MLLDDLFLTAWQKAHETPKPVAPAPTQQVPMRRPDGMIGKPPVQRKA